MEGYIVAFIGLSGVLLGIVLQGLIEFLRGLPKRKLDRQRKRLLKHMLSDKNYPWISVERLSAVIGADEEETKRLLIDIGARGSLTQSGDWALLSRKPLPKNGKEA